MSFDPNKPVDDTLATAAELRDQLNALKALIDAQQQQLAPLIPILNRSAAGKWTLTYAGPAQALLQVWARYPGSDAWSNFGELQTSSFPALDGDVVPDGAAWWQIKICGEGDFNCQTTSFSNIISFGAVPGV